jgi:Arc/MetJ-type ribon-helix-helix transcriptional regulator
MANVVIDIAAEYTGNRAFKQAETATSKLEKSVAKLGKQLAGVFAASKLYAFSKNAVKAFAADEKAARSLSLALANTGNAFAAIGVEKFIADLQRATGVLDDDLRPAFRTLLTATGDVKKSQDGLALALDIAAGTGKDLGAVSMALAKAYGGQTTALSRLGAGLDKATLKTGDMDVIVGQLTDKFKGQALAAAEGYSGAIAKLAVASANAKEIIGKDLLDAMQLIAGEDGIGGATTAMEGFATQIGNAIYGIGVLTAKIKSLPGAGFIGQVLEAGTQFSGFGALSRLGANRKATLAGTPAQSPGQRAAIDKANKDALRLQKTKNELSKIDNDNTARKLTLTADQLALLELEKKFDVERVGLYAALNQSADSETKMRLLSLIAIKDQNEALAGMIKKANETGDAFGSLIEAIRASIRAMLDKIAADVSQLQAMTMGPNTPIDIKRAVIRQKLDLAMPDITALQNNLRLNAGSINTAGSGSPTYIINAQGIGDQQIASVVQGAIQDLNRYGNSTTYAGAI